MPNSEREVLQVTSGAWRGPARLCFALCASLFACMVAPSAHALGGANGFAVERLYQAAPGSGWLVMDDLSMHGDWGGTIAMSAGYARDPLRLSQDGQRLTLVRDEAFVDLGAALTYERFRLYFNLTSPIVVAGSIGIVGDTQFSGPTFNPSVNPDTLSDARIGFDVRLLGYAESAFRLGAGAQLLVPSGERADYVTDGTYRAMLRLLAAGKSARIRVRRPTRRAPARASTTLRRPVAPRGSELLFGIAAGPRIWAGDDAEVRIGPEVYGESALRSLFAKRSTGVEGLLTGRFQQTSEASAAAWFQTGSGRRPLARIRRA